MPSSAAKKVSERNTSRTETPNRRCLSYTPSAFRTSAASGTVELTGLVIMQIHALGQVFAQLRTRLAIMLALMLNKSSRVIPGLRATPAGITTTSAPSRALVKSSPVKPSTVTSVGMWLKSVATPGVKGATSNRLNFEPAGKLFFKIIDKGWPIPPAAPKTATFMCYS